MTANDSAINWRALDSAQAGQNPFSHLLVADFIAADKMDEVVRDFPKVPGAGSFPLASLGCGGAFAGFMDELRGGKLAALMGDKLGIDLRGKPAMITVRGHCRETDGKIHTDSAGKLVTVLVYMNDIPADGGGRLRLLNGPGDMDDYFAELTPRCGSMVAFVCAPNAWHGHKPYCGERRAIQLNWVRDDAYLRREKRRHTLSAMWKSARNKLRAAFSSTSSSTPAS